MTRSTQPNDYSLEVGIRALNPLDKTRNADPELNKKGFDKANDFVEDPVGTTVDAVETVKDMATENGDDDE